MEEFSITEYLYDLDWPDWGLCEWMFMAYTFIILISGLLVQLDKQIHLMPDFFLQAFKYGKMAHNSRPSRIISLLEVPKRWFVHFYVSASFVVTVAALHMWNIYIRGNVLPSWANTTLDVLTFRDKELISVTTTAAAIALLLFTLHVYRRLYENMFVSVSSSNSRMNVLHYIVGHTHYIGAVALLLAEAPGFFGEGSDVAIFSVEAHHIVGFVVYLVGFLLQHHSLQILAGLRKTPRKKHQKEHQIPSGGMFEMVSCPHMLAEILVYIGIGIVLQVHVGWYFVTIWVIANQFQVAMMNHIWYLETFKDYPRRRKAIIPFLI